MAWTYAITKLSPAHTFVRGDGRMLICYQLAVVSDTNASGDITLSTELATTYGAKEAEKLMDQFAGCCLHWVSFVAGTSTAEPTLTIDDANGFVAFSEAITDGTVSQGWAGDKDTISPLTDAIIACGALADATTKTATFYFWFIN